MSGFRNAALALLFVVFLAHLGGCTSAPAPSNELPGWVRVVVPERDGRSLFVGGAAFAVDPESGIEQAVSDARSQIHLAGTHRFTDLFTRAIRESGVETTAIERMGLKNAITDDYGLVMAEKARRDSVFFRPCGDGAGTRGPAAGGSEEPVCQVFVLMSIDEREWGSVLGELLAVQERRHAEDGKRQIADFAEWLMRQAFEGQPEEGREHSR